MTGAVILLVVVIVVLLIVGPAVLNARDENDVETALVQRIAVNQTVESSGIIEAEQTAYLSFGAVGTVSSVSVKVGDSVAAEQPLAQLDVTDLQLQVELRQEALVIAQTNYDRLAAGASEREIAQAEANLAAAQAQLVSAQVANTNVPYQLDQSCANVEPTTQGLDQAQRDYDQYLQEGYEADAAFIPDPESPTALALQKARASYDSVMAQCAIAESNSLLSGAQLPAAEANLKFAQAALDDLNVGAHEDELTIALSQVRQAELQLEQARTTLESATLRAPFDGVITQVAITQGQTVGANTIVMTLADPDPLHLMVDVDELDILQLQVGQSVEIELEALDGHVIPGTVTRIAPAAEITSSGTVYRVQVDINLPGVQVQQPATLAETAEALPACIERSDLTQLLPVIQTLGGIDGLMALEEQPDGEAQFIDALREEQIDETLIGCIENNGGLPAILEAVRSRTEENQQPAVPTTTPEPAATADEVPLYIGMTADVEIIVGIEENALAVPTNAIQRDGASEYVIIENGDQGTLQVGVFTGITRDGLTVVYGDLAEGQIIRIPQTESSRRGLGLGLLRGGN
ncbi:MAG: hypothetical protein OHK0046_03960 [Anaerolineae bacterium]